MSAIVLERRDDPYPSRCGRAPYELERRDEVVYGEPQAETPLTAHQTEAYARDGYLTLQGLLDARELDVLCAEMQRLKASVAEFDAEMVIAEPNDRSLRSLFRVHVLSPVFRRLAYDARLVSIAEHILGSRVYVHQSRLNYKPGFAGREFYWHSDFETWHVEDGMPRMRAVSISISLADNHGTNGPLMVIPGSHLHYVSCAGRTPEEHYRDSLRKQVYGVPDRASLRRLVQTGGIRTMTGPAGTTTLFDCNTMHGSNGNITPYPRANVFIVYNSVANTVVDPYGAPEPRPEFLAERTCFNPIVGLTGPIRGDDPG